MSFTIDPSGALTFVRGDDLSIKLQVLAPDEVTPVDLTGKTIRAQVRSKPRGHVKIDFVVTVTDAANGEVTLFASSELTAAIRGTEAWWDVEWQDASGVKTIILPSPVTIIPDITVEGA